MKIYLIYALYILTVLCSNKKLKKKEQLNSPENIFESAHSLKLVKLYKLRTLKNCLSFMVSRSKRISRATRIFDIVLINMIKNMKEIKFQVPHFISYSVEQRTTILIIVRNHITAELSNSIRNRIMKILLTSLYEKENEANLVIPTHGSINTINFTNLIESSIFKFNSFVIKYVKSKEIVLKCVMKDYMISCNVNPERLHSIRKVISINFFKKLFSKDIFKSLFNFFPDLEFVINKIKNENQDLYASRKMHHVLSLMVLSFNSISRILFESENKLFKKHFISKYKVKVLQNYLLEQYLFLCITVFDIKMDIKISVYLLLKSFTLFCNLNNIYCPFSMKELTFGLLNVPGFYSSIGKLESRYPGDIKFKSKKRYLILTYIQKNVLNFCNKND